MKKRTLLQPILLVIMVAWFAPVMAGEPKAALPEPAVPPPVIDGELLEPEVTIRERKNEVLYEYRVNGQIYMVKIQPKGGPAYYLFDMDGDGYYDVQGDDPARITIPNWVFFRW